MECLKCGKSTESDHFFCKECMAEMEKYPVKPGTPVKLPRRNAQAPAFREHVRKKIKNAEKEQIGKLYRKIKILLILLLIAVTACLVVSALYVRLIYTTPKRPAGQNYSTMTQETTP